MPRNTQSHMKTLAAGYQSIKNAKTKLSSTPSEYKSESHYRVQLGKTIQMSNGVWIRPTDDVMMTGVAATEIADSIIAAEEVAGPRE